VNRLRVGGRHRGEGLARIGVRRCSWGGEPDVEEGHAEVGARRRSWRPAAEGLLVTFGLGELGREEGDTRGERGRDS
jgi:hypothetical protein